MFTKLLYEDGAAQLYGNFAEATSTAHGLMTTWSSDCHVRCSVDNHHHRTHLPGCREYAMHNQSTRTEVSALLTKAGERVCAADST